MGVRPGLDDDEGEAWSAGVFSSVLRCLSWLSGVLILSFSLRGAGLRRRRPDQLMAGGSWMGGDLKVEDGFDRPTG
jgi:hypothetical protein